MKRMLYIMFSFILLMTLPVSCGRSDTVYQDDKLSVKAQRPPEEAEEQKIEWADPLAAPIFELCDTVIKGKVSNVRDIQLSYTFMDTEVNEYARLFDFTIQDILYQQADWQSKDKLRVFYGISRNVEARESLPKLENGGEYLLFLLSSGAADEEGLPYQKFSDFILKYPRELMLKKENGQYDFSSAVEILSAPVNASAADEHVDLSRPLDESEFDSYVIEKSEEYMEKSLPSDQFPEELPEDAFPPEELPPDAFPPDELPPGELPPDELPAG